MLTTTPIGLGGFLMQSNDGRLSLEPRIAQKCLYYYKSNKWALLTLTTASRSSWRYLTIVRQVQGGERFARRFELIKIWMKRRASNYGES